MPINIIKGSYKYCSKNKAFLLLISFFIVLSQFLPRTGHYTLPTLIISGIIFNGYGLQVIEDVIKGGVRLPKIMPKKILSYGIKGSVVHLFYSTIQIISLYIISRHLNFPKFEIEEIVLDLNRTATLFINHDIISFIVFIVSGFIVVYITAFFMELSLARLADGGRLREAFNFRRIKHAIDIIGWRNYTIGYSKIIISIIVITAINQYLSQYMYIDFIVGIFTTLLLFAIEFRGMGIVYKVYIDNKGNT